MSEALRQHLLMPLPPPRVLIPNPEPRVLVPNMHVSKDGRVPPIYMEADMAIAEKSTAEAVMKIQRRRAQQRLRSKRYRERKRISAKQKGVNSQKLIGTIVPMPNLQALLQKGQSTQKPIGTIVSLQGKKLEKKSKEVKHSPSRYIPRYYPSSGESTIGPGLDDKTKSMMRTNSLVVSFDWKTDRSGRKYLAGSKLVQVNPKALALNKQIERSQGIDHFNLKSEESDVVLDRTLDSDWQCLPVNNTWSQDEEDVLSIKSENPDESQERGRSSERLGTIGMKSTEDQILRTDVPAVTCSRYSLYRRHVLRTRSLHSLYMAAARHQKSANSGTLLATASAATAPRSPQTILNKQSNVTKDTVRINQACSIALFKVRNSLKKKAPRRTSSKVLESGLGRSCEPIVLDSNTDSETVTQSRAQKRPRSVSSDSGGEVAAPRRKSARLAGPKKLRVKRAREKEREAWEACGYDVDEEEEQRERANKVRQRRYNFLRSTKQSARLHTEPSGRSPEGSSPRIISIESLSGRHDQALSWEVVEDDLFSVKEEPIEH